MTTRAEPVDPTSFLPVGLIERLAAEPASHAACSLEGAALFADISGYMQITERFCERGELGLEQLSALLNASFSRYVDVVAEHGGEVVHFAGDGLSAYWDARGGDLAESADRALRCALALRELERAEQPESRANPNLHVGVSAGALWAARIRSLEDHHDFLLGGPALRRAARAEAAGALGEVVVSADVVELLGTRLVSAGKGDGHYLVERLQADGTRTGRPPGTTPSRVDRASLRRMLPGVVAQVPPEELRWTAELRRVCALFARIDGLDEMQPEALEAFRSAAHTAHETMRAYSSAPGQLLFDDKGLVFLTVFGVPYNAHADDCERAAKAGLALSERLRAVGLRCSVGLATGPAFCGVLGNDRRREYATVGRPMNLAARLMAAGRDGVLCAGGEPHLTLPGIALSAAAPLRVKGLEQALPTFRLRRVTERATRPRIFGRKAEQALLVERLGALAQGKGGIVAIVGEAGFGKSSLLRELRDVANMRGIASLAGEAVAAPSATFSAWRGVFLSVFGLGVTTPRADAAARVQQALGRWPELLPLAPLLNAVLPLELAESAVTKHLTGPKRADATLHLLTTVLDRLARKPLLVVLEDGHWMDSSSSRLVEAVAQHLPGILLVIALRPMPAGEGPAAWPGERVTVIELSPLPSAELGALVRDTLGGEVNDEVTAAVSSRTYGNPLFAQEYTLLLRERGLVHEHEGSYRFDGKGRALTELAPPANVQATITSRLDNLDAVERLALKTASVVGQSFDSALVSQVYPVQEQRPRIADALVDLCSRGLLEPSEETGCYAFRHALIRDVAYGVMLPEQRTTLHGAVGSTLAAAQGPHDHALLTHHFERAGDREKTWHHADLAAESALRAGAYREAIVLLEKRLAIGAERAPAPLELLRTRRMLADAYEGLGDNPARDAQARAALDLALRPWRAREPYSMLGALGRMALRRVAPFLSRVHDETLRRELELARAFGHRAEVCYYTSDALGLFASHLATISHAQRCGPCPELASSYAELGGALGIFGLHRPARALVRRSIDVAQAIDDPLALAHAHMIRALYSVGIACFDQAEESLAICQEICERLQDPITWNQAQMIAFWCAHYLGQQARSGTLARTLLARAEKSGHRQHTVWGLRALALFELENDAPLDALDYAERAVSLLSGAEHQNELVTGWGVCALARLRAGDLAGAQRAAEEGLATRSWSRRQTAHSTLAGWAGLAEVALCSLEHEPGSEAWRRAVRNALSGLARHRRAFSVGEPTYEYFRGVADALEGRQRRAEVRFRRGLSIAERLGAVRDRGRLRNALGALRS